MAVGIYCNEIDRYINKVNDESLVNRASGKMIEGIKQTVEC